MKQKFVVVLIVILLLSLVLLSGCPRRCDDGGNQRCMGGGDCSLGYSSSTCGDRNSSGNCTWGCPEDLT